MLLASAGLMASAGNASAQCSGMMGGLGYYDIGRLYQVLSQNVPYYAAFPPVYYSVPVPRTYGYSPFAYPPGTMTPEVDLSCAAQEIMNPYVAPVSTEKKATVKDRVTKTNAATVPVAVVNPYFTADKVQLARMAD